ncbi:MAG: calcium-binding protein, partial [Anaerolineae bacterium]|nr:calcium-binding protein [Anaerolineae bacterium]
INYGIVGNPSETGMDGTIDGGAGNDTITNNGSVATNIDGGDGNDTMTNNGSVTSVVNSWDSGTTTTPGSMDGGAGDDTITNSATGTVGEILGGADNDTITNDGSAENIDAGDGADHVTNTGVVRGIIITGDGVDSLMNTGTVDTIQTGNGGDTVTNTGAGNVQQIQTGAGADTVVEGATVGVVIDTGEGDDVVRLIDGARVSLIDGGDNFDILRFEFADVAQNEYEALEALLSVPGSAAYGSITIGAQVYTWQNFEDLVNLMTYIPDPVVIADPETPGETETPPAVESPVVVIEGVVVMYNNEHQRMNSQDVSAPAALYCELSTSTYQVYDVTQVGNRLLYVGFDQVAVNVNQAVAQGQSVIITENEGAQLIAMPDGTVQLVRGDYSFSFAAGTC